MIYLSIIIFTIIFNLFILFLLYRHRKKRGKKLAWYWGWILPSDIVLLLLTAFIVLAATTKFVFDTFPLKEKRTLKEMNKIKNSIKKYNHDTGTYPSSLQELIGQNPLRQEWKFDKWNSDYKLIYQRQKIIMITSAGPDRKFGTKDDLNIKIKN